MRVWRKCVFINCVYAYITHLHCNVVGVCVEKVCNVVGVCQHFQSLEESHLSQVMLFVQSFIDVATSDRVAMTTIATELRDRYSHLTIDRLLDTFVLTKLTGLEKPG